MKVAFERLGVNPVRGKKLARRCPLAYLVGMKIGVLQINPVVGDLQGNAARIKEAVLAAMKLGADFCVTPEMAITGYPPRDLLLYGGFVEQAQDVAEQLAADLKDAIPVLAGGVMPNADRGKPLFNCAHWMQGGEIAQTFKKSLLPTYDVFDEARYFEAAPPSDGSNNILEFADKKFAVTICEDAWNDKDFWERRQYDRDPLEEAAAHNPDCILNLSASPFSMGKNELRMDMLGAVALKYSLPLVYVNQVGGNDDLVFDGMSCAFVPDGQLSFQAPAFETAVEIFEPFADLDVERLPVPLSEEEEVWLALVTATRDYAYKSGFKKALLGLSGGIDSALTAAVAAEALGRENVLGVLMPSPYSSQGSIDDSLALAKLLDIKTLTLPIEPAMDAMNATLAEPFAGLEPDTTEENIQSRIRGNLLMALSNKFRSLLLTTGNKSELAVGYCTIYGDMSGGYAVISDLPKTDVFAICVWLNQTRGETIPEAIITKPPSAELRPDQKDEDSLPPYEVLDSILELHVEKHQTTDQIIARGFDAETVRKVIGLVNFAEFKRRQAAPGIKLRSRSFGTGWRMPLACKRNV